ncbi:hypothetical protein NQ314_006201 [Rhamnusium bicolor]|uniref:Uncharacterized protein n=1 Tax=Rhamnusium bicolor TaxID=1586634 RepID=A0AAV8Z698_9CUCU|nr:hypothetical protein NQ314_006201 [Rhamnusium bicolor]
MYFNYISRSVQEKVNLLEENYFKPLKKYEEETGQSILPQVTTDVIHKIYGILDVNATELSEEIDAVILYPTASLLEHSYEHITSIYTHILWGTSARRHHLRKTKYFTCMCKRCQDPTEMGTFVSALRCLGTENQPCGGTQLPINPTAHNCEWSCNKCDIKLPNKVNRE